MPKETLPKKLEIDVLGDFLIDPGLKRQERFEQSPLVWRSDRYASTTLSGGRRKQILAMIAPHFAFLNSRRMLKSELTGELGLLELEPPLQHLVRDTLALIDVFDAIALNSGWKTATIDHLPCFAALLNTEPDLIDPASIPNIWVTGSHKNITIATRDSMFLDKIVVYDQQGTIRYESPFYFPLLSWTEGITLEPIDPKIKWGWGFLNRPPQFLDEEKSFVLMVH